MPRQFPEIALPAIPSTSGAAEKYDIIVITPLFGGGVKAGVNDAAMPIRAASIRGQLRFWWRATRGAEYETFKEMLKAENAIWGATDTPSAVGARVRITNNGKSQRCAEFPPDKNFPKFVAEYPAYALFPFQGKKSREKGIEQQPAAGTRDIQFTLSLTYPQNWEYDYTREVETALWAWINFGGLGARTRRGCGVLFCAELAPKGADKIKEWFVGALEKYRIKFASAPRGWLTLSDKLLIKKSSTPMRCWDETIRTYQQFRQGRDLGRNPPATDSRSPAGRSRWTEPDAIRRITGQHNSKHFSSITGNENVFPRAEFGLPIIFHFQGGGDPQDTDLRPLIDGKPQDRMGSPLILKPLMLDDGKNTTISIALLMTAPELKEVVLLKTRDENKSYPVRSPAAANYDKSPLKNREPNGSALTGFLKFLTENNYTEVAR
ncbi:MAG: type III-B CRISPR module RAMP protein Cmr1 [Planctomycetota bacterium]|nr:type III-B CRISPR module RAMP protein Cmr1 [Planctomycetota bacterium]